MICILAPFSGNGVKIACPRIDTLRVSPMGAFNNPIHFINAPLRRSRKGIDI